MIYIQTDKDGFVIGIQEPSIDPVASKRSAMLAISKDDVLINKVNETKRLLLLSNKSKNNVNIIKQKTNIENECKTIIGKHVKVNKVYFSPTSNLIKSDMELVDAVSFIKSKSENQKVKLEDDSLVYVDDFTGIEYVERKNKKWNDKAVTAFGVKPNKSWIKKTDLNADQLKEIELQNETPEQKNKKLEQKAFSSFINRLFMESEEYEQLGKS